MIDCSKFIDFNIFMYPPVIYMYMQFLSWSKWKIVINQKCKCGLRTYTKFSNLSFQVYVTEFALFNEFRQREHNYNVH